MVAACPLTNGSLSKHKFYIENPGAKASGFFLGIHCLNICVRGGSGYPFTGIGGCVGVKDKSERPDPFLLARIEGKGAKKGNAQKSF
jgi:hypothetical protein